MGMKKDIHLSGQDLIHMVDLRPGDLADYVLMPGPVDRLNAILKKLKEPTKNFSFMEYSMYTGVYEGIRVTAGNGGRFSPDSAICTEIVCNAGSKNLIRLGSCGALREDIKVGDLIIVTDVIRGDGVTPYYVKPDYKTTADKAIVAALEESCKRFGAAYHLGACWTTDALLKETREIVEAKTKEGAIAVDMVSSPLLTIAQQYKVRAGAILAVSDNLMTGEMGFVNPVYYMAESKIIEIGLQTIKILEGK